jgi:hypothetical protein
VRSSARRVSAASSKASKLVSSHSDLASSGGGPDGAVPPPPPRQSDAFPNWKARASVSAEGAPGKPSQYASPSAGRGTGDGVEGEI